MPRDKSQQATKFLKEMLAASTAKTVGVTTHRYLLDKAAERAAIDLKGQPEVEAEVRGELGWKYWELGDFPKAEAMHREALRLRRSHFGDEHLATASSLSSLAWTLAEGGQGNLAEAEDMARKALAIRTKLLGEEDLKVGTTINVLQVALRKNKKFAEAEALIHQAVAIFQKHGDAGWVAIMSENLALVLMDQGDSDRTEKAFQNALLLREDSNPLHQRDALIRLIRLYEVWDELAPNTDKSARVAEWKNKLAAFDQARAAQKPTSPEEETLD